VLDPIADKLFVAIAFGVVLASGALTWYEVVGVLARDIIATAAFFITIANALVDVIYAGLDPRIRLS